MKDKKYYTPEISEFHVGFEYEYKSLQDDEWKKGICETGTESREDFTFRDTEKHLDRRRVKHLDRSDIESLGWEYNHKMAREEHNYEPIDCWEISIDTTENKEKYYTLFIYKEKLYVEHHEYQNSVGRTEEGLFKGTIKNKSELKTLLKWLKIN